LNRARVIAIGPATQFELEGFGVESESPSQASSRGLVEHFERNRIAAKRVVLVRSRQGGAELPDGLRSLGYDVLDVPVYDVGPPEDRAGTKSFFDRVVRGDVDVYAFLSSMTVHNFLELAAALGVEDRARVSLSRATVAAIGGPTKNALEKEGIRVTVEPSRATFSDLLDALDHAAKRTNV